jgi:ribosome-associated protein
LIRVTPSIAIDESELVFVYSRASGPGGQNVNKVSTAAQLRFDVVRSPSLPSDVKERLAQLAGTRMTNNGVLIIDARRYRTRERNREDAVARLVTLVRTAAKRPKRRKKTKPTRESKERRLEEKRHQSQTKRRRRPVVDNDS